MIYNVILDVRRLHQDDSSVVIDLDSTFDSHKYSINTTTDKDKERNCWMF